jgi:hypothetical protein
LIVKGAKHRPENKVRKFRAGARRRQPWAWVNWMRWIDLFSLTLVWSCPVLLYWAFGRRTWTALRTGRWAAWPCIYDRRTSPYFFRYAIVSSIAMFAIFLFLAVLLTMGFIDPT